MAEGENTNLINLEYQEGGANFRQGFTLLFEVTKGYLLLNAILFSGLVFLSEKLGSKYGVTSYFLAGIGFIVSFGIIVFHLRLSRYVHIFLERCAQLEEEKEMKLYTNTLNKVNKGEFFKFRWLILVFYGFSALFWFAVIVRLIAGDSITILM